MSDIPCILAVKRVEERSQLGGLSVHLCRPSNVRHTYYFTKSFQRHGQRIIVNFKLNKTSIMIISKTINKTGGEFTVLSNTACCKPCQTCISTKVIKLLLNTCRFKKIVAQKHHFPCWLCIFQQLQGHNIFIVAHPSS